MTKSCSKQVLSDMIAGQTLSPSASSRGRVQRGRRYGKIKGSSHDSEQNPEYLSVPWAVGFEPDLDD